MNSRPALLLLCALATVSAVPAQDSKPATALIARIGETGFVTVAAPSFRALPPRQQALAYWLTQAAVAIDPIIYDQLSAFGLREKRLLEEIVVHPAAIPAQTLDRITQWDPKLTELGLVSNQTEVAKAMYDIAAANALRQLRSVKSGDKLEEDHARDRQMVVNYIMDITGGIEQFKRAGKTYVRVTDYQKMREGVGKLLAELMRIKAEGDYSAIKALVDKYGVRFDPALRDEVVTRYDALNMPTYFEGISAQLTARFDQAGAIQEVRLSYPADPKTQYLSYAAMYDKGLAGAAGP